MSGKTSKRRQRRINTTDEDAEKKTEEIVEISDDNKSTVSVEEKDESIKEETEKPKEETKESTQNGEKTTKEDLEVIETVENGKTDEEKTNELSLDKTNGTNSESQTSQEDSSDIEPLILDSEEQELQFPSETGSENSEIEKSPVINRCKTRRSQSRNLPTPKTPKSLDYNGDTDDKKCQLSELRVNVTRLQPEVVIEEPEIESISVTNDNMSVDSLAETDVTNSSVFVNFDDTARNIDITTTTIEDSQLNASNFLEINKDKSYGQTLRCLTGRKTMRTNFSDYKPRFYKSNIDLTDSSKTYSPVTNAGVKRKLENDSPGEQKKAKMSPGLFSYISSPFKSKAQPELQSSTPKLTSFKFVESSLGESNEKIEIKTAEKIEPKKWCSVM